MRKVLTCHRRQFHPLSSDPRSLNQRVDFGHVVCSLAARIGPELTDSSYCSLKHRLIITFSKVAKKVKITRKCPLEEGGLVGCVEDWDIWICTSKLCFAFGRFSNDRNSIFRSGASSSSPAFRYELQTLAFCIGLAFWRGVFYSCRFELNSYKFGSSVGNLPWASCAVH